MAPVTAATQWCSQTKWESLVEAGFDLSSIVFPSFPHHKHTQTPQSTRLLYAGVADRTEQEKVQKQCRIKKWSSPAAAAAKSESCRELLRRLWGWKGEPPRWSLDSLRFSPLPILSPSSFAHYIFLSTVCWLLLLRLSSGAACSEAKDFPSFFAEFEFTFFSCFYLPIALRMSIWFSWYSLSPVFSCWWILKFIVFGIFYLFVGTGSATIFVLLCFTDFFSFCLFFVLAVFVVAFSSLYFSELTVA